MAEELNEVFTLENKEMGSLSGHKQFITFVAKWEKKYPILKKYKATATSLTLHIWTFLCKCKGVYIRLIGLKYSIENIREL